MTIFDHLKSLLFTKQKIDLNAEDETAFNLFMVNRWVSFYSPEIAVYINATSNLYGGLFTVKQDQWNYLFNMLPKLKYAKLAYIKKTKKEKEDDEVQHIPEFMSQREYKQNLELSESLSK